MLDKTLTAAAVVGTLRDGMTIGIGGWGPRRKPMALVRALLRSPLRDLTVVAYGGPEVGMLCARQDQEAVYGFVSLDAIRLNPGPAGARRGQLRARELDEGLLQWGLRAAACRLLLPTPVGAGERGRANPEFRTGASPCCGTAAGDAGAASDVALLHVDRADRRGNVQTVGRIPTRRAVRPRCSALLVSCEQLSERLDLSHSDAARCNIVERSYISGVVHAPFGAHPTSNPPAYGWDATHLQAYCALAGEAGGWERYCAEYLGGTEGDYLARMGGAARLSQLPVPVF
jgi:glutaconate CoA-transferase subunit A